MDHGFGLLNLPPLPGEGSIDVLARRPDPLHKAYGAVTGVTASTFATFLISETASLKRRQARLDPFHPNAQARRHRRHTTPRRNPGSDLREDVREALNAPAEWRGGNDIR